MVEDVAREVVAAGRARITVEQSDGARGWLIRLVPANARACTVSLVADHPPRMDMFLGSDPTAARYEFWGHDWSENVKRLRELLEAVVAGRYEQTIAKQTKNRITVTGRFHLPDGEHTHSEATRASGAIEAAGTQTLRFEPY